MTSWCLSDEHFESRLMVIKRTFMQYHSEMRRGRVCDEQVQFHSCEQVKFTRFYFGYTIAWCECSGVHGNLHST